MTAPYAPAPCARCAALNRARSIAVTVALVCASILALTVGRCLAFWLGWSSSI